jgi:hypothetical protein
MKSWVSVSASVLIVALTASAAGAQGTDLQPAVQTSNPSWSAPAPSTNSAAPTPAQARSAAQTPADSAREVQAAKPADPAPAAAAPPSGTPQVAQNDARSGSQAPRASAGPQTNGASKTDSLQLGTTEISGNRELPKLMYIVPWQQAQIGTFTGRPPNSLVDEALTPVDRAVFERQNRYYAALQAHGAANAPQNSAAPGQDEK